MKQSNVLLVLALLSLIALIININEAMFLAVTIYLASALICKSIEKKKND